MAKTMGPGTIVKINGQKVNTVQGSVEVEFGGLERTEKMADNQFNYMETATPSKVTFKALVTPKTPMKLLNELADGQLEIITDIGVTHLQTSATRMGPPIKMTTTDGELSVEVGGDAINLK